MSLVYVGFYFIVLSLCRMAWLQVAQQCQAQARASLARKSPFGILFYICICMCLCLCM